MKLMPELRLKNRSSYFFTFIAISSLLLNCTFKETPITANLNQHWKFKAKDSLQWMKATVPGNVFTDLLDHNIIENPFILTNEEKVQWVSKKDWIYQTNFNISDKTLQKEFIELNFKGLDTYAYIFLNDSLIKKTTNAFVNYTIDIKKIAKKVNHLKIKFFHLDSIEKIENERFYYRLPVLNRPYTRKAQFQYGWDWGPVLNTSGIWQPLELKAWNSVRFTDIYIKKHKLTNNVANCIAEISIESNKDKYVFVKINVDNKEIKKGIKVKKGISTHQISFTIENPKLWWTHNLGKPNLYTIDFQLIKNSTVKDIKTIKHGIRTIRLIAENDSLGQSFYFELNGKPVYMKGANVIPLHSFQNKAYKKKYQQLIANAKNANMNMLRVWGGGIYEKDIFYDLCDANGILVWQDFMFACAMYPGDEKFLKNVQQEAEYQVKRLRNHASIALWCGNNENNEAWHNWGWQSGRGIEQMTEIWNNYLQVFDTILPSIVQKNSQTDYWQSSPKYGRLNPKSFTHGDAHDWWVWHDAYPFEHFEDNVPRFMSEFGFQSIPSMEVVNYINQQQKVDLQTDAIKNHQKHPRGFSLMKEYMLRDYQIPKNDEDYIYVSQLLQAKGIVMGIEAQRRSKPYNMGTLFWQLNDCWPAISWSAIDYFGNWKALQYKAKNAFKNILISSKKRDKTHEFYIVNDSLKSVSDTLKLKIIDFHGKEIWQKKLFVTVKANSSEKVFDLPNIKIDKKKQVLIATFHNSKSLCFFDKPKNLQLPKGEIKTSIKKITGGFVVTLESDVLQKDVYVQSYNNANFSDNFFDLEPNTVKTITIKTEAKHLDNLQIKTLQKIQTTF